MRYILSILLGTLFLTACEKRDTLPPVISLNQDTLVHYLGEPYIDAGATVLDNHDCDDETLLQTDPGVDIYHYGSYQVTYTATDRQDNSSTAYRDVEVVLAKDDYHHLYYAATDSCDSGVFSYVGLIQDCDCPGEEITVSNISNFGASATFNLPVDGQYNELVLLDTTRLGVSFNGMATMSSGADTLRWVYVISTTDASDVCSSTWVKQ